MPKKVKDDLDQLEENQFNIPSSKKAGNSRGADESEEGEEGSPLDLPEDHFDEFGENSDFSENSDLFGSEDEDDPLVAGPLGYSDEDM